MAAEEEREKAVYIRFDSESGGDEWLMLNLEKDEATPAGLEGRKWPVMECRMRSTPVALGSMIYFLGGRTLGEFPWHRRYHDDVFYFDTRCPNKGLKKTSPMIFPRCNPLAAALDGKIYLFGGGDGTADCGEVFDPNLGLWAPLPEPPYAFGWPLHSDPSNARLLAHPDGLYAYYPASNSWKSLNVDLSRCWGAPSVLVDDVIYFCFNPDGDLTSCLVAYDLVSNEYLDTVWSSDADCAFPTVPDIEWDVLLHLGNGKLCMAMSGELIHTTPEATSAVQCITLKVHKEPAGNRVLVTEPSFHLIKFLACGAATDFLLL